MTAGQVIDALARVRNQLGLPLTITCDNGSQFTRTSIHCRLRPSSVQIQLCYNYTVFN